MKISRVVALFGAILPVIGIAADYSVNPRIQLGSDYSDNRYLSASTHESAIAYSRQLGVSLGQQTDSSEITLEPSYQKVQFEQEPLLDAENFYFSGKGQYQAERTQFKINAKASKDTTLTTESGLLGNANLQTERLTSELSPSYDWLINEKLSLDLALGGTKVSYPDASADTTDVVDYRYISQSVTLKYLMSDRLDIILQPNKTKLNSDSFYQSVFLTDAITAGLDFKFTESLTAKFNLGRSKSSLEQRFLDLKFPVRHESGSLFDASLEYTGDTRRLTLNLSREMTPTAAGVLARTESLLLSASDNLYGHFLHSIELDGWKYRTVNGSRPEEDRDQARLKYSISWQTSEHIYLGSSLDIQWLEYMNSEPAKSKALLFNITYLTENHY